MTPNAAKSQLSRTLAWPTLEAGLKSLPDLHWRPAKGSRGRVKEGSQAKHRPWILLALASFSSSVVRPSPFWLKPITTSRNANNNLSVEKERRKGGWAAQTRVEMRVIPRSDVSSSYYEGAGSRRVGNNLVFAFLKLQIRSFPPVQVCVKIVRDKSVSIFPHQNRMVRWSTHLHRQTSYTMFERWCYIWVFVTIKRGAIMLGSSYFTARKSTIVYLPEKIKISFPWFIMGLSSCNLGRIGLVGWARPCHHCTEPRLF